MGSMRPLQTAARRHYSQVPLNADICRQAMIG
jgi:hypothetical protein